MHDKLTNSEIYSFLVKIIFPAFLAVGVKIAIEVKRNKNRISLMNILLSMIIGVGSAYLSSDFVLTSFGQNQVSIVIAIIAITSEKVGEFLIYKLNVDVFLAVAFDGFLDYITKVINARKEQ